METKTLHQAGKRDDRRLELSDLRWAIGRTGRPKTLWLEARDFYEIRDCINVHAWEYDALSPYFDFEGIKVRPEEGERIKELRIQFRFTDDNPPEPSQPPSDPPQEPPPNEPPQSKG